MCLRSYDRLLGDNEDMGSLLSGKSRKEIISNGFSRPRPRDGEMVLVKKRKEVVRLAISGPGARDLTLFHQVVSVSFFLSKRRDLVPGGQDGEYTQFLFLIVP